MSVSTATDTTAARIEKKRQWIDGEINRRHALLERAQDNKGLVLAACEDDPALFINDWCWTYDPRNPPLDLPAMVPFRLFEFQEEVIRWLHEHQQDGRNGLVEKSRDMGLTFCVVGFYLHQWLFVDGWKGAIGSRKQDLVDKIGDPDSIFGKLRIMLDNLPRWMLPEGFSRSEHDNYLKLINPATGSTITGEAGDNIGRGGRNTIYFIDEHAFLEHPRSVDAAVSQNTECIIYGSTPHGTGNLFAEKRRSGNIDVLTLHWREHPWKDDEWYEEQQSQNDEVTLAQEIDIDYTASAEGVCIPGKWVQAAVEIDLPAEGPAYAGLDVADGGKDKNVWIDGTGPVIERIKSWDGINTTRTGRKAIRLGKEASITLLKYDDTGVGRGVAGTLEEDEVPFDHFGVTWGSKPTDTKYPDAPNTPAYERFRDLRTEDWWNMRLLCKNTWEHINGVQTHDPDQMISIPNNGQLIAELSMPKIEQLASGKLKLESKKTMASSPDFADALVIRQSNALKKRKTLGAVHIHF